MPSYLPLPNGGRVFTCNFCPELFTTKKARKRHRRTEHPPCKRCNKYHPTHALLLAHQKDTKHCYCLTCDTHFAMMEEHLAHIRNASNPCSELAIPCRTCHRRFPNAELLDTHCCICDRVLATPLALESHNRSKDHAQNNECGKCGIMFPTIAVRGRHQCPVAVCPAPFGCLEKFQSISELAFHFRQPGKCGSQIAGMQRHIAGSDGVEKVQGGLMNAQDWARTIFETVLQDDILAGRLNDYDDDSDDRSGEEDKGRRQPTGFSSGPIKSERSGGTHAPQSPNRLRHGGQGRQPTQRPGQVIKPEPSDETRVPQHSFNASDPPTRKRSASEDSEAFELLFRGRNQIKKKTATR